MFSRTILMCIEQMLRKILNKHKIFVCIKWCLHFGCYDVVFSRSYVHSMIGHWHHNVICMSLCPSVCPSVMACPHWQQIVAKNGNKLLPKTATNCCRFRQQIVADFGNKLLPKTATNCCQKRQQIVASGQCGQALTLCIVAHSLRH